MYNLFTANAKTERRLHKYIKLRKDIKDKLEKLKNDPRREIGAHPLHGRLSGKWSCWLGYNIWMIYIIDDVNRIIVVEAIGTHNIY